MTHRRKKIGLTKEQELEFNAVRKLSKSKAKRPDFEEDFADIYLLLNSELEMYSKFSSLSKERINTEIVEHIYEQAKYIPVYQPLKIIVKYADNIANGNISKLEEMYKRFILRSLIDSEHDLHRNRIHILTMLFFGFIAMGISWFFASVLNIYVIKEVLLIACWVFIWRAVEGHFIGRKKLIIQITKQIHLYLAKFSEE